MNSSCKPNSQETGQRIFNYCKNHKEIKLSEVTDFDWDIAYKDFESYDNGSSLKARYGLTGDLETLETDILFRLAFCKGKVIVRDVIISIGDIYFDDAIKEIKPDTIFAVKQYNDSERISFELKLKE